MRSKRMWIGIFVGGFIISGALGFATFSTAGNYYLSKNASMQERESYQMAEKEKERIDENGGYNPTKEIKRDDIKEKAQNISKYFGESIEKTEKVIEKNSIEKKALYLAAEDSGVKVSENEITNIIAKVKKTYLHDEEGKKELNALIAGMGLEEKEYWNFMRPQYKTNLVISKYLKKCYEQRCKDEGINMTSSEFQEKKMKWRSDIVQDAVEKYKVKVQ